jgi:hypothetical protein
MSIANPTLEDVWQLFKEVAEAQKIGEQRFRETERFLKQQSKETNRKIQEVTIQIGHLTNRLGEFVEEMVRPAIVRLFREQGIIINQVLSNIIAYDAQGAVINEVDLLAVNTNVVIVVECKSKLSIKYVNDHLKRLKTFKSNFSQYANYKILGAVTGMVLPDEVAAYAYRKGLFVLAQSGNAIAVRNDSKFKPKEW